MRTIARLFVMMTLLALPLAAQPFPLATPPIGPTPGDVLGGSAASNGDLYLAAWSELRSGLVQIRGIHVTPAGVPVEPSSFRISVPVDAAGEGLVSPPAAASDGKNFVVVWTSKSHLYAAFVPAEGDVRVLITNIDARSVRVVWGGTAYVVLRVTSAGTLAATLIDFDGTLLREGVTVAAPAGGVATPSLAANDDGKAMALWLDAVDGDAHVADVSVDKILSGGISTTVLQSPRLAYGTQGAIGSDGDGFLAVWPTYPAVLSSTTFTIVARPMDSNGATSGPVQTVDASAAPLADPMLFWNGDHYLLIDTHGAVTAQALNPDGTPTPDGPYVITTHSGSVKEAPTLIAGDVEGTTKTFLVWRDLRFGHGEFFGQVGGLDALPVTDEIVLSRSPADQLVGGATWTGSDYLTVWTEKDGVSRIVAARANDHIPIVIAAPQLTGSTPGTPAIAAIGGKAVIVWVDTAIRGVQQTTLFRATLANGAQAASSPVPITVDIRNNDAPSIATNEVSFAVAWTTLSGEIAATTLDASGNGIATPVTLTVKPSDTFAYGSPRLGWNNNGYVLVRQRTLSDGRIVLELQRLTSDLTLIGAPVPLTDTGTATALSVASSSTGVLITWIQHTTAGTSVRAARFSSAATLAAPPQPPPTLIDPVNGILIIAGEPHHAPAGGWDGRNWRIGVDSALITLPAFASVQQVQSIPLATIAAIAGGGPRTFVAFDFEDHVELTVRANGQFISDVPLRHRAVNH
jgi:hypothetical protein